MKLLVAIPHFYAAGGSGPTDGRAHGSTGQDYRARVEALRACVSALHQQFGRLQVTINLETRAGLSSNQLLTGDVDVVVCTAKEHHLIGALGLPEGSFEHRHTRSEPLSLGFECHAVLRERLGSYDYYAYLEDDLITRDPWLLTKVSWFTQNIGNDKLLQPNRYELAHEGVSRKAYLDGDLPVNITKEYQDIREWHELSSTVLGTKVTFRRAANPHAGCFFLNAEQMADWAARPYFLDRNVGFVGPLESAASLGIMRTFRIYKPALENASFLEIEHAGTGFVRNLRRRDERSVQEPSRPETQAKS